MPTCYHQVKAQIENYCL